jgi:Sec8 exocyst complex component specific domain
MERSWKESLDGSDGNGEGPSLVDWEVVNEELRHIPDDYKDQRFDSLRHVLGVLSAVDADAALEAVCTARTRPPLVGRAPAPHATRPRSRDPAGALLQLRDHADTVEGLVDAVVETYHNGFNKAIHNYSQILHHFTEAKLQVEAVRRGLHDAQRRLGANSRNLSQQVRAQQAGPC